MTGKTLIDPDLGPVRLRKSPQARRVSIRVHPLDGVIVTVPRWVPFSAGMAFLAAKRDWARGALARQQARRREAEDALREALGQGEEPLSPEQLSAAIGLWRKEAKAILPARLAALAARYGFTYNRVIIKHNRSNWGSCSARGNINLNLSLVRLPEELRDYVLLHELAHLRFHNHSREFHTLLDDLCQAELGSPARPLEKALKKYILF